MRPANLARRPFRNERLPNLLFGLATVALLGLSVRHAFAVRALLPHQTSALHAEVDQLEKTSAGLRAEQVSLRSVNPDPRALARWLVVKDLVDRRAFSWTELFARLEATLPDGARLVSIAPSVHQGQIDLDVQAMVRTPEVGWEFIRALEESGAFDSVFPLSEGQNGEFHYSMRYRPSVAGTTEDPATAAAASPAAGAVSPTAGVAAPDSGAPSEAGAPAVVPAPGTAPPASLTPRVRPATSAGPRRPTPAARPGVEGRP
jgi:Tfp pilus assembly protein PilN